MGNEQDFYDSVCSKRFDVHDSKFDKQDKKLDDILCALKGNGEPGLCETVRNHTTHIETIEAESKDVKQAMQSVIKWIFGIVGGSWLLVKSPEIIDWIKKAL